MNTKYPTRAADTIRAAHIDDLLAEALKETFPASDPIAIAVREIRDAHTAPSGKAIRLDEGE